MHTSDYYDHIVLQCCILCVILRFVQAMSPDGEAIVTGAGDETLRFWNVFSKMRSTKVWICLISSSCTPCTVFFKCLFKLFLMVFVFPLRNQSQC